MRFGISKLASPVSRPSVSSSIFFRAAGKATSSARVVQLSPLALAHRSS